MSKKKDKKKSSTPRELIDQILAEGPLLSEEVLRRGKISVYNVLNEAFINACFILENRPNWHPETRQVTAMEAELLMQIAAQLDVAKDPRKDT